MLSSTFPRFGSISRRFLPPHLQLFKLPTASLSTDVLFSVENGIRKITFNRPEKKNALTLHMFRALMKTLYESNDDKNTTIIVVTGNGDYFTSGMDMSSSYRSSDSPAPKASPTNDNNAESRKKDSSKSHSKIFPFVNAFVSCQKPVIALVNGPTMGVGVTMLGLFDAVYACESATFQTKFTQFGLIPDVSSTYTFPRIMGYCRTNRILLCNEKITAREAYDYGLVSRLFTNEEFDKETKCLLQEYAKLPVKSLVYSKQLVRGRESDLLRKACEDEQQRFDPEMARKAKEQFLSRKS